MDAEPFDPSDFPKEAFDPETFAPEEHRDPAVPFEIEDWEKRQNQVLHKYLYPEDESEEDAEARTDILVYVGRIKPSKWLEEHPTNTPEDAPETMRNAPYLHRWRMRRPVSQMRVSTDPDAPEEEWHTLIDNTGEQKTGEIYGPKFHTRPGGPTYTWLVWNALFVERIQSGRFKQHDSVRSDLVNLMRGAALRGPNFNVEMEGGTKRNATRPIWRQLLRSANEIEGGANWAKLFPDFDPESLPVYGEEDTPTPRPETQEMARNPFQGNSGKIGAIPAGPFVLGSAEALLKARGTPAETSNRHWGANSTGDPVYVDTLGDPYDGKAIYTVQGVEASRADMDAGLGWTILKEIGPDAVWTHLLLLAHASDPGRRGERSVMRIPRERIGRALGLHKSKSYSARERYERAKKNIQALGSIDVKFQNLQRHGQNLEFRGATTGSSLWNLDLVVQGQLDAFEGTGRVNWHLEATEGNWAEKFLHDNDSPQWTWLPVEWFDRIDRRRSEYARRLAPYLLFLFRAQADEGHRVRLSAETMLRICGVDLSRERKSSQRTGLKNRLLDALNTLEVVYGIGVNDEEVDVKYIPWNDWKGRVAHFSPPDVIRGNLFRSEKPKPRPLPDPGGDWTAAQIRRLRDQLDMTQAELGEDLEVSRHMVSLLENGHRNPSRRIRKTLDKLKSDVNS